MSSHSHENNHELIIIMAGKMSVDLGGQLIQAKRGDLLFYPMGVPHQERSDPSNPVETYFIGFQQEGLVLPAQQQDVDGKIRVLAKWLVAERHYPSQHINYAQHSLMTLILCEVLRLASGDSGLIGQIQDTMLSRMGEDLDLDELARVARMSRFHFLRVYKKLTGRTPMEHLRYLRLERARDLLLTTDTPIKNIPQLVGLTNQHLMTRLFRTHFGTTPGEHRK